MMKTLITILFFIAVYFICCWLSMRTRHGGYPGIRDVDPLRDIADKNHKYWQKRGKKKDDVRV